MAKKFYAVRQGRVPGVYTTWSDCEKQVKGYGGAIYKSFSTEVEARAFVENSGLSLSDFMSAKKSELKLLQEVKFKSINSRPIGSSSSIQSKVSASVVKPDFTIPNYMVAYIDGSYNKETNTVGAGGVIFLNGNRETFSFSSISSLAIFSHSFISNSFSLSTLIIISFFNYLLLNILSVLIFF